MQKLRMGPWSSRSPHRPGPGAGVYPSARVVILATRVRDPLGLFARTSAHPGAAPARHPVQRGVPERREGTAHTTAAAGAGGLCRPPPVAHGHRRVTATPRPPESRTARGTSPAEPRLPPHRPESAGACLQIRTSTCQITTATIRFRSPPSGYHRRLIPPHQALPSLQRERRFYR